MRIHVIVRGLVQGVGFRWFVREIARDLRLAGWVRNRPDGTVEVAAEGSLEALAELRTALADGPPGATVAAVDDLTPIDDRFDGAFTIMR